MDSILNKNAFLTGFTSLRRKLRPGKQDRLDNLFFRFLEETEKKS
jgi:hypothetical protein